MTSGWRGTSVPIRNNVDHCRVRHVLCLALVFHLVLQSCTEPLRGYYERRQAEDARTAGNGRLARNTLEKAIFNQSRRLIAEPAAPLDLIQPSDLEFEE